MSDEHKADCPLGLALGPAGIQCEHGYDVCPICDYCICEGIILQVRIGELDADYPETGVFKP